MKHSLDIAFFGSSLVSAHWNGAATYYRGLLRELAQRGHLIRFYEPDAYERQQHRDTPDPDWAEVIVFPATEAAARQQLHDASNADMIVKASGVGVFDELLERGVLETSHNGARIVYWDVDAPATLERIDADPNDPMRELVSAYDMVLTYGGGEPVVQAFRALGARRCVPIYSALDPSTHFPVTPGARPWPGLHRRSHGKEIVVARNRKDTLAALDSDLSGIAAAGRARTLAEHTADKRAEQLESALEVSLCGA